MKGGSSILARLPYPSTLPRRLAVASEVATLDFARSHGIPTPRILGYSVDDVKVGSEYTLMEKVPGKPIGEAWFNLSDNQRLQILYDIIRLEEKLFDIVLPASGSIYYIRDLPPDTPKVDIPGSDDKYCLGPYAALRWWTGEREGLSFDRGPRKYYYLQATLYHLTIQDGDPLRVLQAAAEKELAWIRAYGRPRLPFDRHYREALQFQKQDPKDHAKSLEEYIRLAPYLVPSCAELNKPILRHPDLQPNNIFVSENFRVTGLIDWQHAVALPAFLAAGIPNSFQNWNDVESASFTPPKLPKDLSSMSEGQCAKAREQFRRRHAHFFYLGYTQRFNEPHWRVLEDSVNLMKSRIYNHAGAPWEGLNTPLQLDLIQVSQHWSRMAARDPDDTVPPCPISFAEQEKERIEALDESHCEVDSDMEILNNFIGISCDGWTTHERIAEAKELASQLKDEGLAAADGDTWLRQMNEQHWPHDDFDEEGLESGGANYP